MKLAPPASVAGRSRPRRALAGLTAVILAGTGLLGAAGPATAATPMPSPIVDSKNGRGNVILNLFQWTWDSVAAECTSTVGPAGFGYVQVSPPQEHIRGTEWWTSYQPVSYRIESKLGTRVEFQEMVDTCAEAGVGVVVDAVVNHTTGANVGSGAGVAGSSFGVDSFPGIYSAQDFNDCRSNISNYGDRYQVQNCRLLSLQDLRTGSEHVRNTIAAYLDDLLGMGVAGFRIDASKHIPAADLEAVKAKLSDPDVFWVHEVIGAAGEPIQPAEYLGSGDSHEFDYARELRSRFDGSIKDLRTIGDGKLPSGSAGVFVDNHDTERNGETMNYRWGAKYTLANTFMLSWPYGSPTVYSGYEWDDKEAGAPGATDTTVPDADCTAGWTCTQRWTEIAGMVGYHNAVEGMPVTDWWDDGSNHIAYGRGQVGYVTINNSGSAATRTYQTSLPAGTYCDVVASSDCSSSYDVSSAGTFTATVPAYGALALLSGDPEGPAGPEEPVEPGDDATTVYYATDAGWEDHKIHYRVGDGTWTQAPGVDMDAACTGWVSRQVDLGGGSGLTAAFNDGAGTWDNNGGQDYGLSGAHVAVAAGTVVPGNPCEGSGGDEVTAAETSFTVEATTTWGQDVYVVGSIPALGSWDPAAGVPMSADAYPLWSASLEVPAGTTFTYKYVKVDGAGVVVWESGADRSATVGEDGTLAVSDSWR
ncbi:carbohydrate-binding module family 20 domain-containing protein [Isoptericola croceus]|uniref:carbohydrate-binding module family 20 domain-containing protein n=1 Tax=Isoptericola croceus TaxID=3031406 RepID=UPI0023F9120E|nr:carbohydrate-binding module family 20 domain-containing protein [Isoptericola croceus]